MVVMMHIGLFTQGRSSFASFYSSSSSCSTWLTTFSGGCSSAPSLLELLEIATTDLPTRSTLWILPSSWMMTSSANSMWGEQKSTLDGCTGPSLMIVVFSTFRQRRSCGVRSPPAALVCALSVWAPRPHFIVLHCSRSRGDCQPPVYSGGPVLLDGGCLRNPRCGQKRVITGGTPPPSCCYPTHVQQLCLLRGGSAPQPWCKPLEERHVSDGK